MAESTTTTPAKIVIKHRYTDAVLFEDQPTYEQQAGGLAMRAALETATKSDADLGGANLYGADLRGANLGGANLGGDKKLIGERPVFIVGPIGSRSDFFTAYLTDKGIYLRAGCFFGTVIEFTTKLGQEHGTNEHAQEYMAALMLIDCHAKLWMTAENVEGAEVSAEAAEA